MPVPSPQYSSSNQLLFSGTAVTASVIGDGTTTTAIVPVDRFTSAFLYLATGTGTGTSPTCNVYVQTLLPDGATWTDLVSFSQATTGATTQTTTVISQLIAPYTKTDATLAAGTLKANHIGSWWRVKVVIGGTNPSYATIKLYASFYE